MYSDYTKIDSTTVLVDGQLQVRTVTVILRDDEEISRMYHRKVLEPGDDLTTEDPTVVAIAQAVWTPEVIAAWEAQAQNLFEG